MRSVQRRLLLIFLAMTMLSLVLGLTGAWMLLRANESIENDQKALTAVGAVLEQVDQVIVGSINTLDGNDKTLGRISERYAESTRTLQRIQEDSIPRLLSISRFRVALLEVTAVDRALLLTLVVKNIPGETLDDIRQSQEERLAAAVAEFDRLQAEYERWSAGDTAEFRRIWSETTAAFTEWRASHQTFISHLDELKILRQDMIRGGGQYDTIARMAYDTVFVAGRDTHQRCEQQLDAVRDYIVTSVVNAVSETGRNQTLMLAEVKADTENARTALDSAQAAAGKVREGRSVAKTAITTANASLRAARVNFRWQITLSALILALGLLASTSLARRVSQPIRDMTVHIANLARGDLSTDLADGQLQRQDELGHFARATQDLIDATRSEIRLVDAMAGGDYTIEAPLRSPEDQLGRALGSMLKTTNLTLRHVNGAVDQVARGAGAVSNASQSLSKGAVESAAALEEISASITHIGSQTRDNANNAQEASRLAVASRDAAGRGYDAVTQVVAAMKEIQEAGASIANVAKLIDNIAFQTNLLALNASVEAARAGRHGKGFSVVADEVRNLASRSAKAARESTSMIERMIGRMNTGATLVTKTDGELREIVAGTAKVAALFNEISRASSDQSEAITQVGSGLRQIDEVIQQNSANAGQTAAAAETLSRQAADLAALVERFRLRSDAAGADLPPPPAAPARLSPPTVFGPTTRLPDAY